MNWKHIKTIFNKEILDTIRDKKTLYVMILVPIILMPLLTVGLQALMKANMDKEKESISQISVRGYYGPLIKKIFTEKSKIKIVDEKVISNNFKDSFINAAIEFPKTLEDDIKNKEKVNLKIIYDATSQSSSYAKTKVDAAVNEFSQKLINNTLLKKGINPQILQPMIVSANNVAGEEKMGALILAMILPMLITMWSVIGGMYTAIDIGAGEKERETLEALLVAPPSRLSIVFGKFLAILFVAMVTITLVLISMVVTFKLAMPYLPFGEESIALEIDPITFFIVLIISTVLAAALAALMLTLSISARNFKQAQNYITPLYLIIMIPAYVLMTMPDFKASSTMYLVPIVNSVIIFKELLMGEILWQHITFVLLSSAIFAGITIYIAIRIFTNEKVLFKN